MKRHLVKPMLVLLLLSLAACGKSTGVRMEQVQRGSFTPGWAPRRVLVVTRMPALPDSRIASFQAAISNGFAQCGAETSQLNIPVTNLETPLNPDMEAHSAEITNAANTYQPEAVLRILLTMAQSEGGHVHDYWFKLTLENALGGQPIWSGFANVGATRTDNLPPAILAELRTNGLLPSCPAK